VRGVVRQLDEIETANPATRPFLAHLRAWAREFQLDAIDRFLTQTLDEQHPA
jgi:hypothetical protein